MLMEVGRLFTQLNEGERRDKKNQPVSVRSDGLLIDFHGSCFGLITLKATVKKKCNRKLEWGRCQNQQRAKSQS